MNEILRTFKPKTVLNNNLLPKKKSADYEIDELNLELFNNFVEEHGLSSAYFTLKVKPTENNINYLSIRKEQDRDFAYSLTESGIEFVLQKETKAALHKFMQAIDLDKECIEAFIGRGTVGSHRLSIRQSKTIRISDRRLQTSVTY
jgi:hypothetical protein